MLKQCMKCRHETLHPQYYAQLYLEVFPAPMHFMMINLIGKLKLPPQGHQYSLPVIDMLINYAWHTPLHTKEANV